VLASLRLAARATIGAALTGLALPPLVAQVGLNLTTTLTGIFVALMAPLVVDDATVKAQRLTTCLLVLPAGGALVAGAAAAPSPLWGGLIFLVAVFAAIAARKYGPRGTALGGMAFMSYFLALYLRPSLHDAALSLGAVVIAIAIAYATRFWLVRDPGIGTLVHGARSFHAQIALLLDDLIGMSLSGGFDEARRRRLRREMGRLNEAALAFEDLTRRMTAEGHMTKAAADDLRHRWLETELAAEQAAAATMRRLERPLDEAERARIGAALRQATAAVIVRWRNLARKRDEALLDMESGLLVAAALDEAARQIAAGMPGDAPPASASTPRSRPVRVLLQANGAAAAVLDPFVRQALQATLACGLAMVGGRLISADRWPWAVLTAYVVYSGSSTRSETIVRAWQRFVGTVAGVCAGFAVPLVAHGHEDAQLALAFGCIFFGTYFLKRSYALMVFFFTAQLGILYDLMGRFSPQLLLLRLEETMLGAVLGVVVAASVLPAHGSDRLRGLAIETLDALAALLRHLAQPVRSELVTEARALDRRMQDVRSAARPLTEGPFAPFATDLARAVQTLSAMVFYGRQLAFRADGQGGDEATAVADRISGLAAMLRSGGKPAAPAEPGLPRAEAGTHQLGRIDQLLGEMQKAVWGA
jgi:uncharacterized membrane protein YccC